MLFSLARVIRRMWTALVWSAHLFRPIRLFNYILDLVEERKFRIWCLMWWTTYLFDQLKQIRQISTVGIFLVLGNFVKILVVDYTFFDGEQMGVGAYPRGSDGPVGALVSSSCLVLVDIFLVHGILAHHNWCLCWRPGILLHNSKMYRDACAVRFSNLGGQSVMWWVTQLRTPGISGLKSQILKPPFLSQIC